MGACCDYKMALWEKILLGIIGGFFVIFAFFGVLQYVFFFISFPVAPRIMVKPMGSLPAPCIMVCPSPAVSPNNNTAVLKVVDLNNAAVTVSTDAQKLVLAASQPGSYSALVSEAILWSSTMQVTTETELKVTLTSGKGMLTFMDSATTTCKNGMGEDLGCGAATSYVSTQYGLCAFINMTAVGTKSDFMAVGAAGALKVNVPLPPSTTTTGAQVFFVSQPQYFPKTAGIPVGTSGSQIGVKMGKVTKLKAPYNQGDDDDSGDDFKFPSTSTKANQTQEAFMGSGHGIMPLDCDAKCAVLHLYYECSCLVPYAGRVFSKSSLDTLTASSDWIQSVCGVSALSSCIPTALTAFGKTPTSGEYKQSPCARCRAKCLSTTSVTNGESYRATPVVATGGSSSSASSIDFTVYPQSLELMEYEEFPFFTIHSLLGAIVVTIITWLLFFSCCCCCVRCSRKLCCKGSM